MPANSSGQLFMPQTAEELIRTASAGSASQASVNFQHVMIVDAIVWQEPRYNNCTAWATLKGCRLRDQHGELLATGKIVDNRARPGTPSSTASRPASSYIGWPLSRGEAIHVHGVATRLTTTEWPISAMKRRRAYGVNWGRSGPPRSSSELWLRI